jgi:hypothetical protein
VLRYDSDTATFILTLSDLEDENFSLGIDWV